MAHSAAPPAEKAAGYGPLFRRPGFLPLWLGQVVNDIGAALTKMAFVILITERSAETWAITGMLAATMLPMLFIGPVAGVLADRWDKKRTMLASNLCSAAILSIVVLLQPPNWALYLLAALHAIVNLFFAPSRSVAMAELVGKDLLLAATALGQTTYYSIALVGPALGGAIVGLAGTRLAFGLDVIGFLVSFALIASITFPPLPKADDAMTMAGFFADLTAGLTFLRSHPSLWYLTSSFAVAVTGLGFFGILFVDYARNMLGLPPGQFGMLESASFVGTALATFAIGQWGRLLPRASVITLAMAVVGVGMMLFALHPGFYGMLPIMALMGLAQAGMQAPFAASLVEITPAAMRGRVFSSTNTIVNGTSLIGLGLAAPLAGLTGTALAIGLMGTFVLGSAIWARLRPGFHHLNRQTSMQPEPEVNTSETSPPAADAVGAGNSGPI